MIKLANNAKFIIYFSFYDTGAIGLKEIHNYGVIAFTHQKEFVISNDTSFFVPELADEDNIDSAYKIILNKSKNLVPFKMEFFIIDIYFNKVIMN